MVISSITKPVTEKIANIASVGPNAKLYGLKIHRCNKCGAPGIYSKEESIRIGWSGCYDPARDQQQVGSVCPNCGANREANKDLGILGVDYEWPFVVRLAIGIGRRIGLLSAPTKPKEFLK